MANILFTSSHGYDYEEVTQIEKDFDATQSSDGTVFCVKNDCGSSIFVLHNGKKVRAIKSWDGEINGYSKCFGDALYFKTETEKIYKATFHLPCDIHITFIRYRENGETFRSYMLQSRTINGKEVIYRACDDPTNGIIVDVEEERLEECALGAIHRDKLIYTNSNLDEDTPANLSPNIIVIKCEIVRIIANDDSLLVYFCTDKRDSSTLFALDTATMDSLSIELPRLENDFCLHEIVGVHGEEITMRRETTPLGWKTWQRNKEICKAKFPDALKKFVETVRIREKKELEEDEKRIAEIQEIVKKTISEHVDQKMHLMNEEIIQIRLSVDALKKENKELKDQLSRMESTRSYS